MTSTASAEAVAAAKAAQNEMYQALLSRRKAQVEELEKKAALYKELLVQEMVSVYIALKIGKRICLLSWRSHPPKKNFLSKIISLGKSFSRIFLKS